MNDELVKMLIANVPNAGVSIVMVVALWRKLDTIDKYLQSIMERLLYKVLEDDSQSK